jgi:hypothetical protein
MVAPSLGEGYCGNGPCGTVGENAGAEMDIRAGTGGNPPWVGVGVPGDCTGPGLCLTPCCIRWA